MHDVKARQQTMPDPEQNIFITFSWCQQLWTCHSGEDWGLIKISSEFDVCSFVMGQCRDGVSREHVLSRRKNSRIKLILSETRVNLYIQLHAIMYHSVRLPCNFSYQILIIFYMSNLYYIFQYINYLCLIVTLL